MKTTHNHSLMNTIRKNTREGQGTTKELLGLRVKQPLYNKQKVR